LGSPATCADASFDLERLKEPLPLSPDAEDMEMARVKALHFGDPERAGGAVLRLETRSSDRPSAMGDLLRSHLRSEALPDLRVIHAELQVRLRTDVGSVNSFIRLWKNRCNLGPTPL